MRRMCWASRWQGHNLTRASNLAQLKVSKSTDVRARLRETKKDDLMRLAEENKVSVPPVLLRMRSALFCTLFFMRKSLLPSSCTSSAAVIIPVINVRRKTPLLCPFLKY